MSRNTFCTLIVLAILLLPILGCEKKGRENPLDPTNPETSGDPFGLEATIGNGGVALSWAPVSLKVLEGYNIYRSNSESSGFLNIAQVPKEKNSYADVSVENGRSYYYQVSAFGGGEESDYTNVAAVHINTEPVLVINSNSTYTSTRSVSLTILADTAAEMWISNSSDFSDGTWEDYSTSKEWLLLGGEGVKVAYLKAKYPDDNISRVVSDSIGVQPMSPGVAINEDREYTAIDSVTLTLSAQGAVQMMISNDPSFAGVSWEVYSPTKAWMLLDEDGLRTVYTKFENDFGVESEVVSDEIILDTIAPTSTITSPSDGDTLSGDSLTIVGTASVGEGAGTSVSGVSKVEISMDGGKTWNPATGTTNWSYEWELPREEGTYTVMSRAMDDAGNVETEIEKVNIIVYRFADIYVPDDFATIQAAINAAVSGNIIMVKAGIYYENIVMEDGITLLGEGADVTIIDGGESGSVITARNTTPAEISGFTIQNGKSDGGGGINADDSEAILTISNNIIINNSSSFGGAICGQLGRSVIKNNIIGHNSGWNGGAIDARGEYLFVNNIVVHNNAGNHAGGIMVYGTDCRPVIKNNVIAYNSTSGKGGGILCTNNSNPTIINNIIVNNVASNIGGGIGFEVGGSANISYNDVWGNNSDYGGGASAGVGDISADPLFVDPDNGDYHLQVGSPCIDAGDPNILDPDGSRSDRGAYGGPEGEW